MLLCLMLISESLITILLLIHQRQVLQHLLVNHNNFMCNLINSLCFISIYSCTNCKHNMVLFLTKCSHSKLILCNRRFVFKILYFKFIELHDKRVKVLIFEPMTNDYKHYVTFNQLFISNRKKDE